MAIRIQLRKDFKSAWESINPILAQGEIGIELSETPGELHKIKIGDGITTWNNLPYFSGSGSATYLKDLLDVNIENISNGQILVYDESTNKWKNSDPVGGAEELSDLNDVSLGTLSDKQVLTYNESSGKWENADPTGGAEKLADLEDVSISNPKDGEILIYDVENNTWINTPKEQIEEIDFYATSPDQVLNSDIDAKVLIGENAKYEFKGKEFKIGRVINKIYENDFRKIYIDNNLTIGKSQSGREEYYCTNSVLLDNKYIITLLFNTDDYINNARLLFFDPLTKEFSFFIDLPNNLIQTEYPGQPIDIYNIVVDGNNIFIPVTVNYTNIGPRVFVFSLEINLEDYSISQNWMREIIPNMSGIVSCSYPEILIVNDGTKHLRIMFNDYISLGGEGFLPAHTELWKINILTGNNYSGLTGKSSYVFSASIPNYLKIFKSPIFEIENSLDIMYVREIAISEFNKNAKVYFKLSKYILGNDDNPDYEYSVFYGKQTEETNAVTALFYDFTPDCGFHSILLIGDYIYATGTDENSNASLTLYKINKSDGTKQDSLNLSNYCLIPRQGIDLNLEINDFVKVLSDGKYLYITLAIKEKLKDNTIYYSDGIWTVLLEDFSNRYVTKTTEENFRILSGPSQLARMSRLSTNIINNSLLFIYIGTSVLVPFEIAVNNKYLSDDATFKLLIGYTKKKFIPQFSFEDAEMNKTYLIKSTREVIKIIKTINNN